MSVFLDTNIILDHVLERKYYAEIDEIFTKCYLGEVELYVSSASIYTLTYFIQKTFSISKSRVIISDYLSVLNVIETTQHFLEQGINSDFKYIEDAYQYFTALSNSKIDYFITGNLKDIKPYEWDVLPVINPKELLEKLKV